MRAGASRIRWAGLACATLAVATVAGHASGQPGAPPGVTDAGPPGGLAFALQSAVANNPAAKSSRAQLTVKRSDVWSAQAARLPSLSGQVGTDDAEIDRSTVSVAQPLFAFGRIHNGVKKAQAALDAETWALRKSERVLIEETAMAYGRIQGIRRRDVVASQNIAEHERLYERIERRRAGRLASDTDVRLAFSRLVQAQAQQATLAGDLAVALAELQALTQAEVDTEPDVDPMHAELPDRETVEALALERSAALKERVDALEALRYDVTLERARSLPTLSARVEHAFGDRIGGSEATRVGLFFQGNVEGAGFVALGRVRGAAAKLRAAEHDLDGARTEIIRRTRTLIASRDVQSDLIRSQRAALEAAAATKESFERQFESGHKTFLELLNIQRELAEVGLQLAQAKNEWLVVSLQLAALTGRLDALAGLAGMESI
jgi:adhesin transport system outer membrane protein